MTEKNLNRECQAVYFDWQAADFPDYGEPGQACQLVGEGYSKECLSFACPGCGKWGTIYAASPKRRETWDIKAGSLADVTTLTLAPSIHCIGCCQWHGFLVRGRFQMSSS